MNKSQMLDALENTKQLHMNQMEKIEHLLNGDKVSNPTPVGKVECECGVWFYKHQDFMVKVLGAQLFERLDTLHEKWHYDYVRIYEIFFKKQKTGFFSKLTGGDKIDPLEFDKAKLYFSELNETTKSLLQVADVAVRRVTALNESKFE